MNHLLQDTGIGMTSEAQCSLFQAFSQANIGTTRKFGGTGLGLAISYKLAQLMNLQSPLQYQQKPMWAESQIGKGSIFYFTITTYKSESGRASDSPRVVARRLSRQPNERSTTRSSNTSADLLDSPPDTVRQLNRSPISVRKQQQQNIDNNDTSVLHGSNFSTIETPGTRLRRLNGSRLIERQQSSRSQPTSSQQTQPVMVQRALGFKSALNNTMNTLNGAANNSTMSQSGNEVSLATCIPGEKRMVLVIDPSITVYESINDYLIQRNYKTMHARSHRDALELLKQCNRDNTRIDCCLITHDLPRIDGVQTWQSIQTLWAAESRASTPGFDSQRRIINDSPSRRTPQQPVSRQNSAYNVNQLVRAPQHTKGNPSRDNVNNNLNDKLNETTSTPTTTRQTPNYIDTANTLTQLSLIELSAKSPPTPLPFATQPIQLAASRRSSSQPGQSLLSHSTETSVTSIQSCITAFPMPSVVFILPAQSNGDITHLPDQYWYSTRKPLKLTKLLPLIKAAIGGKKPSRNPIKQQELLQKSLATHFPLNILLAEDNAVNLKVALKMFSLMGYTIDTAANGQIAVDKVITQQNRYHLIFLDMQMPVMDGVEACGHILAHYRTQLQKLSAPIVIAMTANVLEQDRMACFNAGCVDFISKPVQMKVLQDKIKYWGAQALVSQR